MIDLERLADAVGFSATQRELLQHLLRDVSVELPVEEGIRPRSDPAERPLSFAQQRLWFLHRLDPASPAYNMPAAVRLAVRLDVAALRGSLTEVVRRHEVLRTALREEAGAPVPDLAPAALLPLPVVDLSTMPPAERTRESDRLAREEARRPFDLGRVPLLRGTLVRQGDGGWMLLLTLHHVVGDGWSIGVLVRELGALYEAFAAGRPSPLPELPIQYADFASWQRRWLSGEELERQLGFWRDILAGAPATLELPADRPRPPVASLRGGRRRVELPADLAGGLRALGQERGATLFMVLLATFAAQLARWSGTADLVVGSPIANRNRAEIEGLVGFFVNTLPLRVDLEGDPAFRDLLHRVRETTLAAYAHQDLPFERLIEELRLERSPAHSPLFQVLFALQNAPVGRLDLAGLSIELAEVDNGAAKVDLELSLEETVRGIEGTLTYSLDTFEPATADRLLRHWQTLLRGAVEEPGTRIWDLPLLDDKERQQLLEWSRTEEVSLEPGSIQGRFETWVERTPEAVALVWEEGSFTYRELNRRANLLAHHLLALGLEPEDPVGICLERSSDLVVSLLAALKAGGAYLPLDPGLTDERLAIFLEDAQGRVERPVVLTRERWAGRFSRVRERGGSVVLLDGSPPPAPPAWETDPEGFADPDRLAYISFTSGSTGRPKGVAVPHSGVLRLAGDSFWARMGPEEVFLQLAPVSFDASTLEIWGPLLTGGRLAVFPSHPPSLEELGDFLARFAVTTLWLTTGLFHQMVDGNLRGLGSLRQLLTGGDVVSAERVTRVLDELPAVRLVVAYGPTEGTTFTTCWPAVPGGIRGASVPLGRPIANTEVYLLDRSGRPVPTGVPSELWVGGDGLARGYAGRPDLTAERFRPHPFSPPGARLYRTGDLARYRPDGLTEFLGRIDHQVKIRGFRVEPGEIEAVLCEHPAVRQAAVVARGTSTDDRRLVAYVVWEERAAVADGELREHLRRRLPEYMVPADFVLLAALPLTPNGKLDRRALPEPDRRPESEDHAAPRTPVEELLATLFADLLGMERIGVQDDFFLQGGHSLLATRVVSRVREVFGVEIPLVRFFEAPTVAGLAAAIAEAQGVSAPPMVRVPRSGELPLSFAQQRLWFLEQLAPGSPLYNMPLAVRARGDLRLPELAAALREIVRRHEALRTQFPAVDGSPVQVVAKEAGFELARVDLSALAPDEREIEVRRLLAAAARRPFDLVAGPLLRALLLRLDEGEGVLFLNLHHIVADGWSTGVLLQELSALYRGSALPKLPIQYADFAAWQRSWLSGEVLDEQLAFWRERLAGVPVLDLPTDRPRPPVQSFRGAVLPVILPPGLAERVADLGRRSGVTPFMALLAAFSMLLARVSGQDDLAVGAPIANRNRAEIEGLIGFFVNTLALRVGVADDPAFADLLARVREATLEAYAHQDLPFEKLVEELAPQRDHSRPPLVQVVLALQNAPLGPLDLPGVTLETVPVDTGTAKFELTLALAEEGGGLAGGIEYAADLFDEATVRRLWDRFERLLAGAVDAPERRTSDLPLLDAAELHQILSAWSGAEAPPADGVPVVRLFAERACRAPLALAVVDGDGTLSYGDLDRRAGALAALLRLRGVGSEAPLVAVCCERSADLVVAVLAVLEAGGAYLPLDPAYPAERLSFMLEDAGVRLLLTHERVPLALPAGVEVLRVDRDPGFEPLREMPVVDSRHRAYAIYTSGSTGRPKGTELAHAGLANLAAWHRETYGLTPDDRCTLMAGVGFDASVWEIWPALTAGASLWIPSAELLGDPAALLAWMTGQGVTVSFLPTPVAEAVLAMPPPPGLALRFLLTGGDRLHRRALPGVPFTLVNHYGPTEGTVVTTAGPVGPGEGPPSLGRPISGVRTWVVDGRLAPVPAGTPGELCVAGVGLARGYLGRPDLTAERFRPDPLGSVPGERLYRTGDLVRWRPDGELEFLGRIDHQVKVRGVRIELGEIEAVLAEQPGVRAAAAAVFGGRLVAWYVADPEISPRELREHLRRSLPDSMLPSDFVRLDALPLTPNGKVDRQALPTPGSRPGEGRPKNATEEVLAAIWEEVLGVRGIEAGDDFFALGGHSLLATRVLARARAAFGVELPLSTIFEAPTLEELAAQIAAARRSAPAPDGEPLRPVPRDGELPLSFTQERLWFLDQFEPGNAALDIPASARLLGRLDAGVLESALAEVVRRHESLRTTFGAAEGRPYQRVVPPAPVFLPLVDLSGLPDHSGELARIEAALAGHAFDLGRGPLWIARLVRLARDEHAFLLCLHHVIADGWSMGVLFRELGELYGAYTAGLPSPLAEPALQVADFAVWQRRWLAGGALDAQLAFWRQRLTGELPALDLPLDHPRPPVRTFCGRTCRRVLPPDLSDALRALGQREGTTLFMTLLAAFDVLLSRLSGQRDILVGTPIAGRTRAELEGLIGCFLNTLVLRADLSGEPSFRDLLARVREVCLSAYEHQDLPFETLLAELAPERDLSRTPLFQVFFNMLNLPPAALRLPDLEIVPEPLPDAPSKFDLTLYVSNPEGEIAFDLVFNADLLSPGRIEEMLRQYELLLRQISEAPEQGIEALSLVTVEARALLPDPRAALSDRFEGSVPQVFSRFARREPAALAAADGAEEWTYGELAAQSHRLAHFLMDAGILPGDVVAIHAHRSAPLVWALLGVLESGAAFLILDPTYPAARQIEMLRLAQPRAWLEIEAAGALPAALDREVGSLGCRRLRLQAKAMGNPALAGFPAEPADVPVGPDAPAYVAFTSGSTGGPKGVLGRHGSLSHFLPWLSRRFDLSAADRFSLLSGLAHDPLHRDVFTPLQLGAAVLLPDPDRMASPGWLAGWARRQGITVSHMTPAMAQLLTTEPPDGEIVEVTSLRYAFLVGESLTRRTVERLRRLAPAVTCVNLYGSTETQRAVGYHVVAPEPLREDHRAGEVLPLGRGMEDVQLLVLGGSGELAGVGELGEIWLRSPLLALGYLGDPQRTRERFRKNPFTGEAGDRLYRTGDLGRYLPDGQVAFAGRADSQVKVRGFRVEPGEIEAALARHPDVREAAVLLWEDGDDRAFLAAYLVPVPGRAIAVREVRSFLEDRLPAYMVPAAYMVLEELPLTPNRKLDRRALPRPEVVRTEATATPKDPAAEVLAGIWADLLGLERVGVSDNFFELGGHSLLATRLLSRVRQVLGVELSLQELFEAPTVAGMAAALAAARGASGPPLARADRSSRLPLSFAQQRLWFLDRFEPGSPLYNIVSAFRASGTLEAAALASGLQEIVRRHETLRTSFASIDGRPVQVVSPEARLDLAWTSLAALPPAERTSELRRLLDGEAQRPFDLGRGSLFRARLLEVTAGEWVVLLSIHHIVSDGWSMGVLLGELSTLYGAALEGASSPLPELPVQYADFAVWQRSWLQGEVLEAQLAWWREQLGDGPAPLDLPTDRPRPVEQSFRGDTLALSLPAALTAEIRTLARRQGATLYMILLAALQALLHRWSGQEDVAVGSPVANRTRTELEGLIGFFANTLVMRGWPSAGLPFRELLAALRKTVLEAHAHQDLPFEKLVEELAPARDLGRSPLFQVMLVVQNTPAALRRLPGLEVSPVEVSTPGARFDLTWSFAEHPAGGLAGTLELCSDLFDPATALRMQADLAALLAGALADPARSLGDLPILTSAEQLQAARLRSSELAGPAAGAEAPFVSPRTPMEETLAGIWSEVLRAGTIGIHDSFFDLGGHSLLATRVLSRVRDAFGVEIPVRRLFARPTIAGLAGEVQAARREERERAMPPLVPVPRETPPPLSFAQQRLWFLDRFDPGNPAYNIPRAFRLRGRLDRAALAASLGEIVRRHEVLRTCFQEIGEEPVQVISAPAPVLPALVDLSALPADLREGELDRRVREEAFRPFDLSRGPLLRSTLFGVGEDDHSLILIQHHAVSDGWSQGVLGHELSLLYDAASRGRPSPLAGLPVQYADFAAWQRAWLDRDGLREHLAWWRRELAGVPVLDLPTDHPRPAVATSRGEARPFAWPAELARDLRRVGEGEGATLFMVLLAGLQALLGRYSGQEDLVVGSPVANRNRSELEGLIGFFVNMLALRGDLSGAPTFRELLARVRERALEAYAHQDVPFDRLVEELQPERDTGRSPIFQVAFQLFNVPVRPLDLRGLEVSWHAIPARTAKFDLNLSLVQGEDGLLGSCEHRSDLFEAATVDRMMGHLRALLEGAVADPERRIADLPALSEAEQRQLAQWLDAAYRSRPASRPQPEVEYVAPRSPIETALAALWAELLGVERISVHDSFFELGGHSLLAARLVNRLRELFGVDLLLRDLFQAPTVAALAQAVVRQTGSGLVDRRLPALRPDPDRRHEPFPLTDVQQAYWIGRTGLFELGNISTHVYLELESAGLDLDRLAAALRRVIERHDMLRMVIQPDGRQRVLPAVPDFAIPVQEGDPESVRERMSHQVLPADRWPLFDLRATRLSGGRTRLHVSLDALMADAWSFRILARDLVRFYRDPEAALPPLEVTFRDYVLAEIEMRGSDLFRRSEEYWRGRLSDLPPAPELPLAKSPGSVGSPRFARRSGRLEPTAWQALRTAGARRGLTPSGFLLAAFSEVLAAWSKSSRFTLTLTLFQRLPLHPEVTEIVGDFTSVTLLAVDGPRDVPFEARAQRLQERLWMDLDHGHMSGVRVLRELARAGGGQAWALPVVFTSTLALERSAPADPGDAPPVETVYSITQTPQVWLDHQVSEQGDALVYFWDAVEEIFPPDLLDDMFSAYAGLLARLAGDEGLWGEERLGLVPSAQLARRAAVNATAVPESGALLQTLFQEQARRRPEEAAVIAPERSLTYRELERRAFALGARLRALGARPNRLVAIAMEKGWEQVVAALAVVSSGAAYLPVDPELPRERFRYLLEHGEVGVALTQSRLEERLDWPEGVRRIPVDREDGEAPASLPPVQGRKDLAYVIFTSGSTGVPKGVMIDHRGAVNTVLDVNQRFGVRPGDRVLALSSLSFDLSVWDVFGVLAAGGAIVLPEPGAGRDPSRWLDLLRGGGVTVWNSVPALLEMLVEYAERNGETLPASLRLALLSGDWIPVSLPDRVRRLAGEGVEIVSLGGATEASIWSIYHPIGRVEPNWKSIPYGRPLANQTFHVLDEALEPRPDWVPGHLHIGGIGIAQGYWRDSKKTAARFFVHPRTGERLYDTGDLGRYLPDGDIEFLGREDFQVKIQGYRIELGDIEAALAQHPGVAAGVAAAVGDRGARRLVAWFVPAPGHRPTDEELREHLAGKLPAYMVPAVFLPLESLPLTDNGKVDRKALPAPAERGAKRAVEAPSPAGTEIEARIAALWREALQLDEVGPQENFFALGGNSILMVQVHARLQEMFGDVSIVDLFQYPTVRSLATHLASRGQAPRERPAEARRPAASQGTGREIAIVGMAGRFPRAESLDAFWRNLREGVEAVSFFSDEELLASGFSPEVISDPRYVRARAILEGADLFDAGFFGLTPRQAVLIDPQHRIFLECAWEALESAGYDPETWAGEIGVFAGSSLNTYIFGLSSSEDERSLGNFQVLTGNDKDYLATRVSYLCNLRGPSLTVQTACSTSLVAVHMACRSLLDGECDMALAGGVSISAPQKRGYIYNEGGTGSPDGHCRAFDARAQGTVSGEGAGIVVLKRLADALADGDRIEAVIRGSALNNDGSSKVGYTAPSVGGQAAVIAKALQAAGVPAETIQYVEAHGTGTPLGDPIEIAALTQAFCRQTGRTGFCALGSVKTNIGHLDAAAGVAGLIKTVLALRHGLIPPSLHFERPNPRVDFPASPFYVNQKLAEWRANGTPRRAGVSSFGFGGTNAHVVLEEAPPEEPASPSPRPWKLLVLSARTPAALDRRVDDLAAHLEVNPDLDLDDVAWTLQVGRRTFVHRATALCRDAQDALEVLRSRRLLTAAEGETDRPVAFLFPGQGARPAEGLAALSRAEPVFRREMDRCAEILGLDLWGDLRSTAVAQPVLFAVEHSLAELWRSWGVQPGALLGHSLGEYVAACVSGVLSLESALRLVAERGRLMEEGMPEGAMLAVPLPAEEVEGLLGGDISLAAVNAPSRCVLSGPPAAIAALAEKLAGRGVSCQRLEVERAFHSRDVEAIQPALAAFLRRLDLQPPRIPFLSCLTGTWITDEEATNPVYWARQMRAPVRFADAVDALLAGGPRVLLEVGPGGTLASLARQHPGRPKAVSSLLAGQSADAAVVSALGGLWLAGARIDWNAVHAGERRRRVALPSYPFERSSYWFATKESRPKEKEAALLPVNGNGNGHKSPGETAADLSSLEEIVSGQLAIMRRQLELLQ